MKTRMLNSLLLSLSLFVLSNKSIAQLPDFTITNNTNCGWNVTMAIHSGTACGLLDLCTTIDDVVLPFDDVTIRDNSNCGTDSYWSKFIISSGGNTYSVTCLSGSASGPSCGGSTTMNWNSSTTASID